MKGLLLKDWFMVKRYCRYYAVITVLFLVVSVLNEGNLFVLFYPCMICGMIPMNLMGFDERSGWTRYSETLPYTRGQLVSVKYLIGLLAQLAVIAVTGVLHAVSMQLSGTLTGAKLMTLLLMIVITSLVPPSISLPFFFRLGVEKGRMAYYLMVGVVCAVAVLATGLYRDKLSAQITVNLPLLLVAILSVGIYCLSWYLSIVFYRKREI